jgi:Cep192 domain 4/Abnormal spindle-like microcephaly-assoc'd, ASPM-SPD-2-Hydin
LSLDFVRKAARAFARALSTAVVFSSLLATIGCGLAVPGGGGSSSGQTASALSPSSSTVSFGNVTAGSSAAESVVLTDSGPANIAITSISISGANFSVKSGAAVTLTPNQTTTITVMFTPAGPGSSQGTLAISSDASNSAMDIMLTGTGVGGTGAAGTSELSPSSTTLTFGNVTVGSSTTMPLVLTNDGTADVGIDAVTVSGAGFSYTMSSNAPLNPKGTVTFTVKFDPTVAGASQGTLRISSNATNSPLNFSLSGTGVAPPSSQLKTPTTSLAFGNVTVGAPTTKTLTLTDSGTANIVLSALTATGNGFSVSASSTSLNPNGTATVSVKFNPSATGGTQGTLSISSNATNSLIQIPLSGTGLAASNPATQPKSTLTANAAGVGFGSVKVGTLVTQSVVLTDTGTTNVTISGVSTKGTGFSASGTNVTLTPNGSVTISVSFVSVSAATAQGTLSISSNASNSTLTIPLTGTGVAAPTVQHTVGLNWQPSTSQVVGYFVYRGSSAADVTKLFVSSIASTSYTDNTVVNGETYFYAVTSVDADNVESFPSNQVSAAIPSQ